MLKHFLVLLACLFSAAVCAADEWVDHPENVWVKQSPTAERPVPKFGWEGSGDYDPWNRHWIHHAGHDGIPQGAHLFTYDLQTRIWEQKFPPTSPPGVCCVDGSHVFDVANRRYVRFPGGMLGHGYQWSRGEKLKESAVWLYDPAANSWMNMRPAPYARNQVRDGIGGLNAGACYDRDNELAISFGGQASSGGTNNFSLYDAYSNHLYRIDAAGAPSPRDGMGLACDSQNGCIVVFGSQYSSDAKTYLYRYSTAKWEAHDLEPHPPAKKLKTYSSIPKMAFDSINGLCLCVTWDDATGNHETWALDVAKLSWTKLKPPAEPSPSMSRARNLGYSPELNVFILELAPQALKGKGAEVWTYRMKKASPAKAPAAPVDLQVVAQQEKVVLTWKAAGPEAKKYRVERSLASGPGKVEFAAEGTTEQTSYEDMDLLAAQKYVYRVRALDADGKAGPPSNRAYNFPRVLIKPVVSVLTANKVEVSWHAHPARDVIGFNVYRGLAAVRTVKKGEPKPWRDNDPEYAEPMPVEVRDVTGIQKLNDKPIAGTTFTDETVDLGRAGDESAGYKFAVYAFIIKAVGHGGESGPSPYALTIPSEPVNVLNRENGATAELKWDASPERGIAGYHVYKLEGTWSIKRLTERPIKETTYTHQSAGATRYWIVAVDAVGQEGQPSSPAWHQQRYDAFFRGEWHQ
jgi:hypothetical protein